VKGTTAYAVALPIFGWPPDKLFGYPLLAIGSRLGLLAMAISVVIGCSSLGVQLALGYCR
jgi:hypothetical protein